MLWWSDLRGFTARSDRLPGTQMIALLNALFDAQATAIATHGGEILKFIGDGLLAIFPIEHADNAAAAARCALDAAMQAVAAARGLVHDPSLVDEPPLEIVVAFHIGTAIYGNIGAADRLDFTVIGPAVNLVSRIEAVAKALDQPIVVGERRFCARLSRAAAAARPSPASQGLATPHDLLRRLRRGCRVGRGGAMAMRLSAGVGSRRGDFAAKDGRRANKRQRLPTSRAASASTRPARR